MYNPKWGELRRQIEIPDHPDRSWARRDYARLLHSPSFRRLQGKTQLFPGAESDFFRNRLTHSLEVAQIAKTIGGKLNRTCTELRQQPLDTDLLEFAGMAHDLGHPPFGHNGEAALDCCMAGCGGFEGNAQTLRILARLEKRELPPSSRNSRDERVGLNLTFRTLASILKYDKLIPPVREEHALELKKGYYSEEQDLVKEIKRVVTNVKSFDGPFKTIECQIMDLADDIAYSTYDFEDALKAGFFTPFSILGAAPALLEKVAEKVSIAGYPCTAAEVIAELVSLFGDHLDAPSEKSEWQLFDAVRMWQLSQGIAENGAYRTRTTSGLVNSFVNAVEGVDYNKDIPALSNLRVNHVIRRRIEVLKRFTYQSIIMSSRLKVLEYRGFDIVCDIFDALTNGSRQNRRQNTHQHGYSLLPSDYQQLLALDPDNAAWRKRVVCDFIAGMTDRYAVEFYGRLKSVDNPATIFKPF